MHSSKAQECIDSATPARNPLALWSGAGFGDFDDIRIIIERLAEGDAGLTVLARAAIADHDVADTSRADDGQTVFDGFVVGLHGGGTAHFSGAAVAALGHAEQHGDVPFVATLRPKFCDTQSVVDHVYGAVIGKGKASRSSKLRGQRINRTVSEELLAATRDGVDESFFVHHFNLAVALIGNKQAPLGIERDRGCLEFGAGGRAAFAVIAGGT